MPVEIKVVSNKKIGFFNIAKTIRKLISMVPKDHLIGLKSIIVVDTFSSKHQKNASALYWRKNGLDLAFIEISISNLYYGMPSFLFYVPFVAKFMLASALFHEIGHHFHHVFKHGIDKRKKEQSANNYKKEMLKRAFWRWKIIFFPIAPLLKYLLKKPEGSS
jgi:hypothetical protein